MKNYKRIAIIPARGGSKRLPRKNIIDFYGKPIIFWTIKAAVESNIFDDVFVSTEDEEIKKISKKYSCKVLNRLSSLATDSATIVEVILSHLKELNSIGKVYDYIYCLYPTAPLRNKNDLINISNIFEKQTNVDSVIAVTNFSHYPFQALKINDKKNIEPFWPEYISKRSTDLPNLVAGNGSTYAVKTDLFLKYKSFLLPENNYAYEMQSWKSLDLDNYEDLILLESIILKKPELLENLEG